MAKLLEYKGYQPDEVHSLSSWMSRDHKVIKEESERFYWYDRVSSRQVKDAHLLIKSLLEDHAAAPSAVIERVLQFAETSLWCRDPYDAIRLMDDLGHLPVDRNVCRLYEMAMRDDAMSKMKSSPQEEHRELATAFDEFKRILDTCEWRGSDNLPDVTTTTTTTNNNLSQDKVRQLAMNALRVHRCSKRFRNTSTGAMKTLWGGMTEHAPASVRTRLDLIIRASRCCTDKWSSADLMMVLWGLYVLMDVGTFPESSGGLTFEEAMTKTLESRAINTRLPIPSFAVDVKTYRGRNCADTRAKLVELFESEEEACRLFDPIEASHGPSPHDTKQTQAQFKKKIEECEHQSSDSSFVPRLFLLHGENDDDNDNGNEDDDEQTLKRLQKKPWQAVLQLAAPEPFDLTNCHTISSGNPRPVFLVRGDKSYLGPLTVNQALQSLAISRLGTILCGLSTVPTARLRLNRQKDCIYLEQTFPGNKLRKMDVITVSLTNLKVMLQEFSIKFREDVIKTLVFRRLVGMPCSPSNCLVESTGYVRMADLKTSRRDYARCQHTVKRGSAHWLFDISANQNVILQVSDLLEHDTIRPKLVSWLIRLLQDHELFEIAIPKVLAPYTIPLKQFQENVRAVIDAYTAEDDSDDTEDEDEDEDENENENKNENDQDNNQDDGQNEETETDDDKTEDDHPEE